MNAAGGLAGRRITLGLWGEGKKPTQKEWIPGQVEAPIHERGRVAWRGGRKERGGKGGDFGGRSGEVKALTSPSSILWGRRRRMRGAQRYEEVGKA